MQDGQGNAIGAFHEGDGTGIQTIYQGDGTVLWEAVDVLIVDDFERGDLDPYEGDIGKFDVVSDPVYEGSYAIELKTDPDTNYVISSTEGLDHYPEQGEIFSYRIFLEGDTEGGLFFGIQTEGDIQDGYFLRVREEDYQLYVREDGSFDLLAETHYDDMAETWLKVTVDWGSDGTIECGLHDDGNSELASISTTDDTFESGGIGFRSDGAGNDYCYIDYIVMER